MSRGTAQIQKSLRLPKKIVQEVEQISRELKQDFSATAKELLEEAVKIHHCPGIIFAEGIRGKRARIAGTGLEVWELIATYKSVKENWECLQETYHWLTDQQISAALGYYKIYPEEINALIRQNESWTLERIAHHYPFLTVKKA